MQEFESRVRMLVEQSGLGLYDVETVRENEYTIFRVTITSPSGVSLDQCEEVSRILSPLLDVADPVKGEYFFEVSSPGIERPLKKPHHFTHAIGERVKIKCKDGRVLEGELLGFDGTHISVQGEEGSIAVELPEIKTAKTVYVWE